MKVILYLIMVFLVLISYIKNDKKITPLVALFGPIVTILLLVFIIYPDLVISNKYLFIHLIVLVFWISIEVFFIYVSKTIKKKTNKKSLKIFFKIGLLSFFLLVALQLKTGLIYGLLSIKGNQNGIIAHLYNLFAPFFLAIFIRSIEKKRKSIYLVLVCSLVIVSLGPKLEVFILLIPCFLYYYENKKKSITILVILFLSSILIFYIAYFFLFYIKEGLSLKEFHKELLIYYKIYLFSPIIIGNELLKMGVNPHGKEITFSWFYNTINMLKGNKEIVDPALSFIEANGIKSNVGGLISELFYNLGNMWAMIYLIILGIISYFIETIYLFEKNWIFLSYYLKGVLVLGFFNNTFSVLTYIEKFVGCFLITSVILILGKLYREK